MAFRFDTVSIPTRTEQREDGLYAYSTVCRDGILQYFTSTGQKVRELRPASANRDDSFLRSLEGLPATIEHPSALLLNRESLIGELFTVGTYMDSAGVVDSVVRLRDLDTISRAKKGEKNGLSLGYLCDVIQTPDGVWYDSIDKITYRGDFERVQTNIVPNHLALTDSPRGGAAIRIHLDSADAETQLCEFVGIERFDSIQPESGNTTIVSKSERSKPVSLKTLRIDGVDWEIESGVAATLSQKLDRLDAAEKLLIEKNDALAVSEARADELYSSLETSKGTADGLEQVISEISEELDQIRADASKKMEEDDEEDDDDDDEDPEYEAPKKGKLPPFMMKGKKGAKKEDSTDRMDSDQVNAFLQSEVESRLDAFAKANELLESHGTTLEDAGIETKMDAMEIIRTAIAAVNKDVDLSEKSDDYVSARFDAYVENIKSGDESPHTRNFAKVVSTVKNDSASEKDKTQRKDACSGNHKKALTMSKRGK